MCIRDRATGGVWQQIGEEISEKLDYTPSSLFVRRIVRPKYVVRFPHTVQPDELQIAELPPEALPKSKAAPGLVADVIVSKLVDHLPLYRQEQRYARQGFAIARSTLCGCPQPVGRTQCLHHRWPTGHRQQHRRAGGEAVRDRPQKLALLRQRPQRPTTGHPVELHRHLPTMRREPLDLAQRHAHTLSLIHI